MVIIIRHLLKTKNEYELNTVFEETVGKLSRSCSKLGLIRCIRHYWSVVMFLVVVFFSVFSDDTDSCCRMLQPRVLQHNAAF